MARTSSQIIPGEPVMEGAGVLVHRPFPSRSRALSVFDPFLLLDEMGPMDVAPNSAKGFPDHPHRGFETVTYMRGNAGKIEAGDVQWMTAGSGLVHSEAPEAEFLRTGGHMHGFQIWVNLPKRDKMMEPRYQEVPKAKIPEARTADGKVHVRVIARDADSILLEAAADSAKPMQVLLLSGEPIGEPVARYGPFVMNTRDEVQQAMEDFQAGTMGTITR